MIASNYCIHPQETKQNVLSKMDISFPFAYVKGQMSFMNTKLKIDERAYIPTVETSYLVKYASSYLTSLNISNHEIIDVGTGSGNIAIKLSEYFPLANITATDISYEAISLASENKRINNCSNIHFCNTNLIESLNYVNPDLIVANLPWGSEGFLLRSHTLMELSYMPRVAIFPETGLIGSYVELIEQIRNKDCNTTLIIETGVIPEKRVQEELPKGLDWNYIGYPDYSISIIKFS